MITLPFNLQPRLKCTILQKEKKKEKGRKKKHPGHSTPQKGKYNNKKGREENKKQKRKEDGKRGNGTLEFISNSTQHKQVFCSRQKVKENNSFHESYLISLTT